MLVPTSLSALATKENVKGKKTGGREERGGGEGDIVIYFRFAKWLAHAVRENTSEKGHLSREGFPKNPSAQLCLVSVWSLSSFGHPLLALTASLLPGNRVS